MKDLHYVEKTFRSEKFITEEQLFLDDNGVIRGRFIQTTPLVPETDIKWSDIVLHSRLREWSE